jgi:NRAMP (natural resistance-associated macrophage protein)-like metal ion transporter
VGARQKNRPPVVVSGTPSAVMKSSDKTISRFFADLGPGLISGAADDDPSGISTFSVVGASFGYSLLWTALLSFPLMVSVQLMCARLGMVTGRGLAGVLRKRYPRWVVWGGCALLVFANVVNIGADLGGMAESTEMLTGVDARIWTPLFAALISALLLWSSYRRIVRVFKWLTLALLSYIGCAFFSHPDWRAVLEFTFVPRFRWSGEFLASIVAILGTNVSPYLFFWQAAQEVEEERSLGRDTVAKRRGASRTELRHSRADIVTGMFFSNLVMYFIIVTTAATLNVHGRTSISSAREAAQSLRPLAGDAAALLFSVGMIGTGMLGVPVLAGACAYAIAEAGSWRGSLEDRPATSMKFYLVLVAAMVLGMMLDYFGVNAVRMLFWSAVVNGVLAPPLIALVVLLTSNRGVMGEAVNSPLLRWTGWFTACIMSVAALLLLISFR